MRPRRLPPGRHGLPHDAVVHDQRERLMAGALAAAAEKGVTALTVEDILSRSHVSRRTFYQQFTDKADVLAAALDDAATRAIATGSLGGLLRFLAAHPVEARCLFVVGAPDAGPFVERLGTVVSPGEPDPTIRRFRAGGVFELIRGRITADRAGELEALEPTLTALLDL